MTKNLDNYTLSGNIPYPAVFIKVIHHPRNFTDFIQTGAAVNKQYRKMKIKRPQKCTRQSNPIHADRQTYRVKHRIAARRKYSVDRHRTDTTADHIKRHDHKHACHILLCKFCKMNKI